MTSYFLMCTCIPNTNKYSMQMTGFSGKYKYFQNVEFGRKLSVFIFIKRE